MHGVLTDDDVAAWLASQDVDGPDVAGCVLIDVQERQREFHYRETGFGLIERTGNPRGRPKLPPKPRRERQRPTPEEVRANRLARNARYRNKPETRAKFYAWRNEHRRKRRAAGVPYAHVDRRVVHAE